MQVEMGNPSPTTGNIVAEGRTAPTVERMSVPESYTYVVAEAGTTMRIGREKDVEPKSARALADAVAGHIGRSVDGITHIPDQEALLSVIAAWRAQSSGTPTWVWSDNEDFAVLLGAYFDCPVGRPEDVELTHHTFAGPPGVVPRDAEADAAVSTVADPEPEAQA